MSHRVIDRRQLTSALAAQRDAGRGKIGEWLRQIGAVEEEQITRALGEQWGCSVLRSASLHTRISGEIPFRLMSEYRMMPVHYVDAHRMLYMGFAGAIEYSPLYAIEQMLQCRAVPCAVAETAVNVGLNGARCRECQPAVFETPKDETEMAKIVRSYAVQVRADEGRVVKAGDYIWARLRAQERKCDVLFRVGHRKDGCITDTEN